MDLFHHFDGIYQERRGIFMGYVSFREGKQNKKSTWKVKLILRAMFVSWCVGFGEDLCKDQLWTCRYRRGFEFNRDALRPVVIIQHRPGISYKKWYCGQWLLREVVVSGSGTKVYQSDIGNNLTKWNHEGPLFNNFFKPVLESPIFSCFKNQSTGHSTNGHVCMNFLCEQNVTVAGKPTN